MAPNIHYYVPKIYPNYPEIDTFNDTYELISGSGSDPYDHLSTPFDIDGDGWNNTIEVTIGTDIYDNGSFPDDSDHDGIPDPLDPDRDGDGFPNWDDAYPDDGESWDEDVEAGGRSLWWIWGIVLVMVVVGAIVGAVLVGRKQGKAEEDEVDEGDEDDGNENDGGEMDRVLEEGGRNG